MDHYLIIIIIIFSFHYPICSSFNVFQRENWGVYRKYIPADCVFPFTFKNRTYNDCTIADGSNHDVPWCSLTAEYQGLFTYCIDYRNSSLTCRPKYTINGIEYKGCIHVKNTSRYKQCQTDVPDNRYRYCVEEEIPKPNTKPLVNLKDCDPKYKDLAPTHTMCVGPAKNAIVVPINETEKQQILDIHNQYRGNVSSEYMFKLYWDDELAKLAQAHANLCALDHDLPENRISPDYYWLNGQNMIMGFEIRNPLVFYLDLLFAADKSGFQPGKICKGSTHSCLRYTQIMLKDMTRVGCGHTHCLYTDRIERFLVCNYIHLQTAESSKLPYIPSCLTTGSNARCKKREGNLCDCGNKICNYSRGERINPATCECDLSRLDGIFFKREEASGEEDELLEPSKPGSVITATGDAQLAAERGFPTSLHNLYKGSPRKYSRFAQNNNNDRITISVR